MLFLQKKEIFSILFMMDNMNFGSLNTSLNNVSSVIVFPLDMVP